MEVNLLLLPQELQQYKPPRGVAWVTLVILGRTLDINLNGAFVLIMSPHPLKTPFGIRLDESMV